MPTQEDKQTATAEGIALAVAQLRARIEQRLVTRHLTFLVQFYDLPSLLAGKLHAAISRTYAKGRDWYDLMWYLSHRPPVAPNLPMLQNALEQTRHVIPQNDCRGPDADVPRLSALQFIRDPVEV